MYLRLSSPKGFPATAKEFPGSLPAPETFPALPLALRWLGSERRLLSASRCPGHLRHSCRRAARAAAMPERTHRSSRLPQVTASTPAGGWWPQSATARSQLLPAEEQRAPRGQRELGTERPGFPGAMSLPRTDSLGSTKGPWGISRAKGAAAERRGFLGPTPAGLTWEIPAAPGTA